MQGSDESAIWQELQAASLNRTHGWRSPALATVDAHGAPSARTVVLRSADVATRWLVFFTDLRSPKVAQLRREPRVSLLFWCARLQWQLRVQATMDIETMGPRVEEAWARVSRSAAARDYLSPLPPGAALGGSATAAPAGQHHFAILRAGVTSMDWLGLSPQGEHRRMRFEGGQAEHLTP